MTLQTTANTNQKVESKRADGKRYSREGNKTKSTISRERKNKLTAPTNKKN
jgi:hypothetical protein